MMLLIMWKVLKKAGWDAVQYTGYDKLIADFRRKNIFVILFLSA